MLVDKERIARVSGLATPIIAGVLATNIMSLIDTAMVGSLGNSALAGVGVAGQIFFLLLATLLGLSAGVQAVVARRVGESRIEITGKILNAGILISMLISLTLIVFAYLSVPFIFAVLNDDVSVVAEGLSYFESRVPSLLFIGANIAFRSYWVGVSLAKWSMVSIIVLSVANVVFNYLLIYGNFGLPRLEVFGAGLGSTLATMVGLFVNVGLASKFAIKNGFLRGLPERFEILTLLKISYPESLRQILFCLGVVVFYVLVGRIGTRELAAFHVVISICIVAYLPNIGFGGAAITLVGEALGRRDPEDAQLWGWFVSNLGLVVLGLLGVVIAVVPHLFLGVFLVDESTVHLAIVPLQIGVLAHVVEGYSKIVGSALLGAGATKTVLVWSSSLQWLFFLPMLGLAIQFGFGLVAAMNIFLIYAILSALVFAIHWYKGDWRSIQI